MKILLRIFSCDFFSSCQKVQKKCQAPVRKKNRKKIGQKIGKKEKIRRLHLSA